MKITPNVYRNSIFNASNKVLAKKDFLSMREFSSVVGSLNPLPTKRSKVETGLIFFLPVYTLRILGSRLQED